ncbi:MAG TPA: hypothetical protein VFY91_16315 [Microbacterium sp.]|nr:hypothetical protein [Microbacterium sp.]
MRWDLFFEDLEDQLASEWEAERAALDTEAERLRLSRMELRSRLAAVVSHASVEESPPPSLELSDGSTLSARIQALGADWLAAVPVDGARWGPTIVPLGAIRGVGLGHGDLLRSARSAERRPGLSERMTFGFVMRDVARRRVPVSVGTVSGRMLTGTIDRAGADHLDLALHEPGAPRRAGDVVGYRLVPFGGIGWVRLEGANGVSLV